jgi:hypothetical protein
MKANIGPDAAAHWYCFYLRCSSHPRSSLIPYAFITIRLPHSVGIRLGSLIFYAAMSSSMDPSSQDSQSHIEQLLASLRDSIVHKSPVVAGSLEVSPFHLSLLYKNKSSEDNYATRFAYDYTLKLSIRPH